MTPIAIASIVGFTLFIATLVVLGCAFVYYVATAAHSKYARKSELYTVHWDKAGWIYLTFMMVCFLFATMNMAQYLNQGFTVSGIILSPYLRWVMVAMAGMLEMGTLCFIMTYNIHGYGQRFFATLVYTFALLLFLAAALSETQAQQLLWIICSMASFVAALVLLFFPHNMIRDHEFNHGISHIWQIFFSEHKRPNKHNIVALYSYGYRVTLLILICVVYLGYLLIWFLSESNQFSTVISVPNSIIAYTVFDYLSVLPFIIFFVVATFTGRNRKLVVTKRSTGTTLPDDD